MSAPAGVLQPMADWLTSSIPGCVDSDTSNEPGKCWSLVSSAAKDSTDGGSVVSLPGPTPSSIAVAATKTVAASAAAWVLSSAYACSTGSKTARSGTMPV